VAPGEVSYGLHARGRDKRPDLTPGNAALLTLFHRALRGDGADRVGDADVAVTLPAGGGSELAAIAKSDALRYVGAVAVGLVFEIPAQQPSQSPVIPEQQ
jgi:hypothetical protein